MLILVLVEVQYLQNVGSSFGLNSQNHSSSGPPDRRSPPRQNFLFPGEDWDIKK